MTRYYKGDDYDAFDQEWAEVDFDCPEDWVVSRAEIRKYTKSLRPYIKQVYGI